MTTLDTRIRSRRLMERLGAELVGAPLVAGILILGTALLVGAVATFGSGDINASGWESAAQVARWYAGGVGVYATAVFLPLFVTHGYTRREYTAQVPFFLVAFALAFSLSMTIGYVLEGLIYDWLGWEQGLTNQHIYGTPDEYGLVLLEFVTVGAVWSGVGAALGGAFYRRPALGMVLVPVGIVMIALVELAAGPGYAGPLTAVTGLPVLSDIFGTPTASVAVAVSVASFLAALALMWVIVKDVPIRTKKS